MMQPPDFIPHDAMMMSDGFADDSQDLDPQTQQTQQASQPPNTMDGHLWGFLQPCSPALTRIDFWKINPTYTVGRNQDQNDVVLPGFKVSNKHCKITWDGKDDRTSAVTITDTSSNGTFINGVKIGRDHTSILREGNEVAFGTSQPQPANGGIEDYRFVYRHTAAGPATEGLHAFYDISSELGKGSFATVMKAVSRTTGEWFAVKMIHDNKMVKTTEGHAAAAAAAAHNNNNGVIARNNAFAREISILETLKHPNICQLKEVFFQDGNINLVLELVEGGDLLDYILERNGLQEEEARHITYQICDALAYIHSKGIAHRDLKPENVLLTKDSPPTVKVADFGLAKVVDSLTMLRTMCGTPSYLAPEVVMQTNQEGYHNVVDSWSVGVIVFSMLTNASPFIEDESQRDLRARIAQRQIDWNTLAQSNVSQDAQSFIRRLLDTQPNTRMSLAAARYHPWLQPCAPVYTEAQRRAMTKSPSPETFSANASMLSAVPAGDESFRSPGGIEDAGVSQGLQHLQLGQQQQQQQQVAHPSEDSTSAMVSNIPGAFPVRNGIQREGSRTAPLQRRSHVLSQAADGEGVAFPEPSWEMIQNAAAYDNIQNSQGNDDSNKNDNHVAGPSNWTAARGNKRLRSELTPLPEEYNSDAMSTEQVGGDANAVPARKKGKSDDDDDDGDEEMSADVGAAGTSAGRSARGARGKGKGISASAPAKSLRSRSGASGQRDDAMSEDDDRVDAPKPRRSTRQTPQKVARRA